MNINDVTPELIGRSISTSGKIVYKNLHPAGHLFLTISDNRTKIQVPLFVGFMNDMEEAGIKEENFKLGSLLSVFGLVDEYKGQLQIIPRKVEDIKILSE